MKRELAEEICRKLVGCSGIVNEAIGKALEAEASPEERHACQRLGASLMASLYLEAARPFISRFPELDTIFVGSDPEKP